MDQTRKGPSGAAVRPNDPEPAIVEVGSFLVAGPRYEGDNKHGEIPAMWDSQFFPRLGELVPDPSRPRVFYGVILMPVNPAPDVFEYIAAVEVESLDSVPAGMVGVEVPAQTYAVFAANDVPDLHRVFEYSYREWLPKSKEYEGLDGPWMEVYPAAYSEDHIIYVYYPVRRRRG